MSGRRIDDHKMWAGSRDKSGSVFPTGPHKTKMEHSAEGSGHLMDQKRDTTEGILRDQTHGDEKVKSHDIKPGYRN